MFKHSIMWAFLCATAPFAYSQEIISVPSICCDSIEYSIDPQFLDEVIVKAASVINKNDRKLIRPNEETLRTSTDGVDLLRKLQLPRITVNPLTNTIDVTGGGDVMLCINGVEATSAQIAAIRPGDIIRIEYHDAPGVRYAGGTVVIDYITSRHDSGGNISLDAFNAIARVRWASIDNLTGQYNRGRSVWSANIGYFGQQKDKWLRNYDETWYYPNATLTRHEEGLPVTVGGHGLESAVNYNYQSPTGSLLNIRLGLDFDDVPNKEEGDRRALLQTSDADDQILVVEHTEERSLRPNLALNYQHKLSDTRSLILDAQTSYMHSQMLHEYSEDGIGESSLVKGDKYSGKILALYENRHGSRVWSTGISGNMSVINNRYLLDDPAKVRINQSEAAMMGEYSDRFGNWGVMANIHAVYRHLGQDLRNIDRVFVEPTVNISYHPIEGWFMRYYAALDYKMPSAAEISDVEQPIQSGMVRKGNLYLKPYRVIDQIFDSSFEQEIFGVNAHIEYRNEHKPVMESVIYNNGMFERTYFNQRSFQHLIIGGALSLRPWRDHLSIMVQPMLTRYISHGIDYSHHHNIFRIGLNVDFTYRNFLAYGNIMSGPANYMYGEEIIEEKDMNQIMAGYKRGVWSLSAGIFNAFMNNYWMETRNLSALAPFKSKAHSARSSSYFAVKFNIAFDFGSKGREVELMQIDPDNDSGILNGTK